jgi:two-component system sensor histidine kinase KdpD
LRTTPWCPTRRYDTTCIVRRSRQDCWLMTRGRLRVYLGAAPGVGKTHAMLAEGLRRAGRGADIVVGIIHDDGRASIQDLAAKLERLPTRCDSADVADLDVAAVRNRRPEAVLVDDLAHRNSDQIARWDLVEALLTDGIEVITTVNIGALESLRDIVTAITGTAPDVSIPDSVVRAADQIELVDMSPEALRRRLAHGHIFTSERVDAALANVFQPAVLGALRQLSLLWVADRVEEQLERQSIPDVSSDVPKVRERIVVALGGRGGERLVRRAVRLAGPSGAQVVGVHVVSSAREPGPELEDQRRLLTALGGVYREVLGDDVALALAEFARVEQATQLVIGAAAGAAAQSRQSIAADLMRDVGSTDVHVVATSVIDEPSLRAVGRRRNAARPYRHIVLAWALCVLGLPGLTAVLSASRRHVSVGSALMIDLCLVMAVAAIGGIGPGLAASVAAFGLTNWFLTPPLHTLTVGDAQNVVALTVFILVTVVVSVSVDRAARRSHEAASARAQAAALARSAATLVGAHDPLPDLLEQLRATFGLRSATVMERSEHGWWPTHASGRPELLAPEEGTAIDISAAGDLLLVVPSDALRPEQLEVLRAFGDQLAMAVEARRLRTDVANSALLEEANALRAALLQAVSHDFRTPLATIKASSSGLLEPDVNFSADDRRQLLNDIVDATDRLDRLVRDLLDMSRLQAGAVDLTLGAVALEEVVAAALSGLPSASRRVDVDVSESVSTVEADAALLERAVANLVSNALAWSPLDAPVRVEAGQIGDWVDLRIIDRGPGIPTVDRDRIFLPFQRLGDRSTDAGAGLGLAIAKGFVEAMGGLLILDDTPGAGLTMTIRLHVASEGNR